MNGIIAACLLVVTAPAQTDVEVSNPSAEEPAAADPGPEVAPPASQRELGADADAVEDAAAAQSAAASEAPASPPSSSSSATSSADPPPGETLLVMDLQTSDGVTVDLARTLGDLIVTELSARAAGTVIGGEDLRNLLALEGERQAYGCEGLSTSCMAEIANALGARWVVFGRLSQLGDQTILQLNLMDAHQARPVSREQLRARSVADFPAEIGPAVDRLVAPLSGAAGGTHLTEIQSDGADGGFGLYLGVAGLSVGGLSLAIGAVLAAGAVVTTSQVLDHDNHDKAARENFRNATYLLGGAAAVGLVVGLAGLTAGAVGWGLE